MNANEDMVDLKIQAYLDGELSADERADVERLLAANPSHRQLLEELRQTSATLSGNGLELQLPETREFYWSKIARQIERESAKPATVSKGGLAAWIHWVRRHFMGVAGAAFAACLALMLLPKPAAVGLTGAELELASKDMGSFTFRDQQQETTMVWLYDRTADNSAVAEAVKADTDDVE